MPATALLPQPDDPDAELREVFTQIDEDHSNRLTKEELQAAMLKMGEKLTDDVSERERERAAACLRAACASAVRTGGCFLRVYCCPFRRQSVLARGGSAWRVG